MNPCERHKGEGQGSGRYFKITKGIIVSLLAGQDFKPVSPPTYVYDAQGNAHVVYGWATFDGWANYHPVVANPDGPGIGPWRNYYGSDPWKAA